MHFKSTLWISLIIMITFLSGCQNEPNMVSSNDFSFVGNPDKITLDIPEGAQIDSATFNIFVIIPNLQSVNVHRITAEWEESGASGITWNNFGGAFAPEIFGTFTADASGWRSVDLTGLVQLWLDGINENFGILLDLAEFNFPRAMYGSREDPANSPFLEVCYTFNEEVFCETAIPIADAYINESIPDNNTGTEAVLFTGWGSPTDLEKQSLIQFELNVTSQEVTSISDFVWFDENMNGIQDEGEIGIAGVEVHLFDCQDNALDTTFTDEYGNYLFDSLTPGDYYLMFIVPEGYAFSPADQGENDSTDSDTNPETGMTMCTTVEAGENDVTWDAGLFMLMVEPGCTHSKGYWKNHAGFGPQEDMLTQYLPVWLGRDDGDKSLEVTDAAMAVDILSQKVYGAPSNGVAKLYAQLLAAKLNVAAGADDADIADIIDEVDEFLAGYDWEDWYQSIKDDQGKILEWKDILDDYNNGKIGPGYCDDEDDVEIDDNGASMRN